MTECIPIDDINSHQTGGMCRCYPEILFVENKQMIIIHRAFDGRHIIESVNDILNNQQKKDQWQVLQT